MNTDRFPYFKRMMVSLVFGVLACGLIAAGVSVVIASDNPANSAFKDPYNGGIKLPDGGGEPGKAYMAFVNAAYKKDHAQICKLMADPVDVPKCLEQKEALDSYISMFTQPISHKVLGGFMKGEEATLNVAYSHKGAPQNTGFVVMKKAKNRWGISSFGGSGSSTISAEASGTADLANGATAANAGAGQSPEAVYTGPALGNWAFEGKDDKGADWKGTLTLSFQDLGTGRKTLRCALDKQSGDSSNGYDGAGKWDAAQRQLSFGETYSAILSADGKSMTQGKWTEGEEDWNTHKVTVTRTGVWSVAYTGGQADPGAASASGAASVNTDPEFAIITISPNTKAYTGKCPATIAFTANITFKMPPPEKFSYCWEFSNGRKTPDRVLKPPRNGHLSVREVWRGGKQGEELDASVRFVAGAGDASMILDPPGVKVICK